MISNPNYKIYRQYLYKIHNKFNIIMKEKDKTKFFEVQNIRYLNYWILGTWLVLRVLDFTFTYINISLGLGYEGNPIGFNFIMALVGFVPIFALFIANYKISDRKDALNMIFFGALILSIVQTVVTFNAMFGWIFI